VVDYLQTTHINIATLKVWADDGSLDTAPPFQRNPVWVTPQKALLVDSVLRGYPIPELYLQIVVDDKGRQTRVLVDGQQRVTACLEFIEGKFSLGAEDSPEWAELTFEELSTEEKRRLFEYQFIIRVLPDMPDDQLRAIFTRLNRNNLVLNKQELRQAVYWGEFITLMRELAEDDRWTEFGIFTPNDIRRMLDVEFISELAVGALHGPQNKKLTLDRWYAAYEEEFEEGPYVRRLFQSTLGELSQLLGGLRRSRWSKKSDFYSLFLVVCAHESLLPLTREGRDEMQSVLEDFGMQVDAVLAKSAPLSPDSSVMAYAAAVGRAASDLQNRRERATVLGSLLGPILNPVASTGS
jgi:Protein of unknown function DUF262